jgi:DNA polymerase (family 10)
VTAGTADIAAALHEIADLLEIRGENRFRILGYRRVADAVDALEGSVCEIPTTDLQAIPGVGKAMADKIAEFCEQGRIETLEKLRTEVPVGLLELKRIPGVGPKKAMQLFEALGVSSVDELREAAEAERIRDVRGFSKRFEEEVLAAIAKGVRARERTLLAIAVPIAEDMVARLERSPAVERVAYAGSARRYRDTVKDLDLLVASTQPEAVMEAFRKLPGVLDPKAEGPTKCSVVTTRGLQVDLRVVEPEVFGAAMQYFTGSAAHNVKVRQHAVRKGLKLSEYGLFDAETDARLATTEEEVYERLAMQWIPPTMREDRGEVEAALKGELPTVVEQIEIRGDLQSHSTYSDGKLPVREMAVAAADRGYAYFAVTDHGPRLTYMAHLGPNEIAAQREEVARVNSELGGRMRLLHGVELNIGGDGSLDYPDEVLAGFDICVASVHSQFKMTKAEQTKRLITAIENPHVHVIGHPSGRRLDRREGIDFDMAAVAKSAAKHNVALEVNAHPYRLDLRGTHVRWALENGALLVISTDAHSIAELDNMHFGVATAQRGWATPDRVINTWPLDRLERFLGKGISRH